MFSMLRLRCPRCGQGGLYEKVFTMRKKCPECGLLYEREEGYFTGAMVVGNMISGLIVAPLTLLLFAGGADMREIIYTLLGVGLLLMPFVFWYARAIWLYFDFMFNPE